MDIKQLNQSSILSREDILTKGSFQERDELLKVASVLVVVDELLQFISVHHNVQAAHLGQAELLIIHASEADLLPSACAVGFAGAVHGSLVLAQVHQCDGQTSKVGDVVVQQLGGLIHLVVEAAVSHL